GLAYPSAFATSDPQKRTFPSSVIVLTFPNFGFSKSFSPSMLPTSRSVHRACLDGNHHQVNLKAILIYGADARHHIVPIGVHIQRVLCAELNHRITPCKRDFISR